MKTLIAKKILITSDFKKKIMIKEHIVESTKLRYVGGGSDKVYNTWIIESEDGHRVHFQYGRTGSSLNHGTKTGYTSELLALKAYTKLIKSKMAKGYKDIAGGAGTSLSIEDVHGSTTISEEKQQIGVFPQLLNECTKEDVETYLKNDEWVAQEKHDGKNRMFVKKDGVIKSGNRKGEVVSIDSAMIKAVERIPMESFAINGEDLGTRIMVFDLIIDVLNYEQRLDILEDMFKSLGRIKKIQLVKTARTTEEKEAMYEQLQKDNAEGIVFKRKESMYRAGRPASGGDMIKFKFYASATCIVTSHHPEKESIGLGLFDDSYNTIQVGNATVYPSMDTPKIGSLVEIKYLYAYEGGSLYQPVLIGERDDLIPGDCTLKQLKYKREDGTD